MSESTNPIISADNSIPSTSPETGVDPAKSKLDMKTTFDGTVGGLLEVEGGSDIMDAMMMGLAMSICNEMKRQQDHLKQKQREARQQSQG